MLLTILQRSHRYVPLRSHTLSLWTNITLFHTVTVFQVTSILHLTTVTSADVCKHNSKLRSIMGRWQECSSWQQPFAFISGHASSNHSSPTSGSKHQTEEQLPASTSLCQKCAAAEVLSLSHFQPTISCLLFIMEGKFPFFPALLETCWGVILQKCCFF